MSTSKMILKVSIDDGPLHRITVQAPASISFGELVTRFRSTFTDLQDFAVQYVDDEGDDIVVSNSGECEDFSFS
jgi:hypothetical protein